MPPRKRKSAEDGEDAKVLHLTTDGTPVTSRNPPSRKGKPQSEAQKAVTSAARAKMAAINAEARRRKESGEDGPSRWERLNSGELTVRDLDNEELARMQCRGFDGIFKGRPPNPTAKLARAMKDELLRRGTSEFHKYGSKAIAVVAEIMLSPIEKGSDRLRAAAIILERCYGRVPDEVRGTVESAWDDTFDEVTTDYSETG